MRAIVAKDLLAVRRSKAVVLPMLIVPTILLVVLPLALGLAARGAGTSSASVFLAKLPHQFSGPILARPPEERLLVLIDGYLLAPLFLIVPLMVASVLAADAFAGEKERRTLEGVLHLPISDRQLFSAKVLTAFVPSVAVSWVGFVLFATVADVVAWPVMHRIFLPTKLWAVVILWVAPGVAALGMAIMVRVSARVRTTQEANQLGGAVVLPLIFATMGQATGLLLLTLPLAFAVGGVVWLVALFLLRGGLKRFSRDRLAAKI